MNEGNAIRMTGPVPTLPASSRYVLLRCVASGGMGSVYYGIQRGAAGFARPVAIKRAHPHLLGSATVREEILAEARNGSAVRHPNIVSIDDVEEINGELLLVMDYVEGCTLAKLMGLGGDLRLPRTVVVRLLLDICLALDAIQTPRDPEGRPLGLVHGDLSPHNVLVSIDGMARVTDFGLARSVWDARPASPNLRRGTFGYMAPEYLVGGVSCPRADLFAVGVLAWEALAGRRLFAGESPLQSVELTCAAVVPSLRFHDPSIPVELEGVIKRALARSPEARPRSAGELGEALERAAGGALAPRSAIARLVARQRMASGTFPAVASTAEVTQTGTMDVSTAELEIVPDPRPRKIFRPSILAPSKTRRRIAA